MWWLIGSVPDFWGRGPGFESGSYLNDPDAMQDHCVKSQGRGGNLHLRPKKIYKHFFWLDRILAKKEVI